jgi:TonB family protein
MSVGASRISEAMVMTVTPSIAPPAHHRVAGRGSAVSPRIRISSLTISIAVHAAVLFACVWIRSGAADLSHLPASPSRPEDARYAAYLVSREEPEEPAIARPDAPGRDVVPQARGESPVPALDPEEADEDVPLAAAPSIAVDGGAHGRPPREWSDRPSIARSAFSGRGHGSRRAGGQGRGGRGDGTVPGAVPPPPPPVAPIVAPAPPPPPPVRVAARLLSYETPPYPESARTRGLEGTVRLRVEVLEDATVGEVRVVESSGVAAFDDAAIAAVKNWRFAAATVDGSRVRSTITLPSIRFRLDD